MQEAGLPEGVLNVITTTTAGSTTGPLIKDPRLRKLSFTGSTEVGRMLLSDASQNVLRTSMELGGNAPFLVFEDADVDAAVAGAMLAKMRNMGEACTAANRFIVHESVADEFARKFAAKMSGVVTGRGVEDASTAGPLIDEKSRTKVDELVKEALAGGAEVMTGGAPVAGPGYFHQPTVLKNVAADARLLQEEIFGPVAPIVTFTSEDEAVRLANSTEFGLVAYVFTRDLSRGLRMGERLETGMLGLNAGVVSNAAAPFGGVKQSGLGREGGLEGIGEYLYTQYIGIADPYK
jgi:succinate-semialdehyde dehydrogenase/glutarate-semialdehyde dehydrogenase